MSIQEISSNFKRFFSSKDAHTSLIILVVGVGSFFLGSQMPQNAGGDASQTAIIHRAQPAEKTEVIQVHQTSSTGTPATLSLSLGSSTDVPKQAPRAGTYVGSRSGDKYHLPWCAGAKRIKEENKVWFASKEEAERAGYSPASNCKGI